MSLLLTTLAILGIVSVIMIIGSKVKGVLGIILNIPSFLLIAIIFFSYIYLYGEVALMSLNTIDVGTLKDLKAFVNSRFLTMILVVLAWMFVLVKTISMVFTYIFRKESKKLAVQSKEAEAVFFDIPVIPNIVILSDKSSVFKDGLDEQNLVFSFALGGAKNYASN